MPWNPFEYQYLAQVLSTQEGEALVELKRGTHSETLKIPQSLLPTELEPGSLFSIKIQDSNAAKKHEKEALRALLEELIR